MIRRTQALYALVRCSRMAGSMAVDADDVVEEVDQVLWTLQSFEIAAQDDAIPARVDELDSLTQSSDNRSMG